LIDAVICRHVTPTFETVHRRATYRTANDLALIEHRKLDDHPIEVEALHLSALQRHHNLQARGISRLRTQNAGSLWKEV
jgi:hypothetical protein